jgi:hypothetical protein
MSDFNAAWQGNLPCVISPKSGCVNHKTQHIKIFCKSELPTTQKNSIFKNVFSKKNDWQSNENICPAEEIWTDTRRNDPAICDPLPLVHSSIQYNLAFYHINSIKNRAFGRSDFGGSISSIRCQSAAGTYRADKYNTTLLLRYSKTPSSSAIILPLPRDGRMATTRVHSTNTKSYRSFLTAISFPSAPHDSQIHEYYVALSAKDAHSIYELHPEEHSQANVSWHLK